MEEFTEEELGVMKALGLTVKKESQEKVKPLPKTKVIKGTVECRLCGARTVQYLKMQLVAAKTWSRVGELTVEELESTHVTLASSFTTAVSSCAYCETMLLLRTKEELIQLALRLASPMSDSGTVLRYLAELAAAKRKE